MLRHKNSRYRQSVAPAKERQRKGAVVVELALTLPLLFLMLFGAVELSHANMLLHTAEAAAYEGARQGILPGATAGDCRRAAREVLDIGRVRRASVRITPTNLGTESDTVKVRVTIRYRRNTIITPIYTDSLVIRRECELIRE